MWIEFNCPRRWFKTGFGFGILEALSVMGYSGAQNINFYCTQIKSEQLIDGFIHSSLTLL